VKARCLCGNLVPPKELQGQRCIPCRREAAEKVAAAAERQRFLDLKAKYLSGHPFAAYMPEDD
jgi:hypothetical protein